MAIPRLSHPLIGALFGLTVLAALPLAFPAGPARADIASPLPPPALDMATGTSGPQTAIFAGGCFWGVQGVFEHVAGVTREAVDRMSEQTARNILSVLDGEPLRQNVINQDVYG
mgnify:CR=1 FL=1